MENDNLVAGPVRKRQEIAAQLDEAQNSGPGLIIDLDSVDQTIRVFRPDIELENIRSKPLPPRHAAYKREYRGSFSVLRATLISP